MKLGPRKPTRQTHNGGWLRKGFLAAALLTCLLAGWLWLATPPTLTQAPDTNGAETQTPLEKSAAVGTPTPVPQASRIGPAASTQFALLDEQPPVSEPLRHLVTALAQGDTAAGALTPEQAAEWKSNFKQLLDQGPGAIPAIREFLKSNIDFSFGDDTQLTLGYKTARLAMIDALGQIGSHLAVLAMSEALQTTADPLEIAALGQNLEKLDPGLHQTEILDAARQTLAMSANGNLPGRDVAPLFETFQRLGGPTAVADLEQNAPNWNFYSMMALAQLPDGAGIPSLIDIANGHTLAGSDARTPALQMLAELATQSADAQAGLADLVRQNSLSAYDWAILTPILAGNQIIFQNSAFDNSVNLVNPNELRKTTVALGEQSFLTAPLAAQTPAQINQQQALLDQLLAVATDPVAVQALQKSKALLQNRLLAAGVSSAP